jgi:hypothetical protein
MTIEDVAIENRQRTKSAAEPGQAPSPPSSEGEQAIAKPSAIWMLVPILLIALAIFLAR